MHCPTEPEPPRHRAPLDGMGPRGVPDCYYTSRVLDSTARYVKFVKKLRALEDEQAKGAANALKELTDTQNNDFFIRCDRRSLINNVARRVELCLTSYDQDLMMKRQRLLDLLSQEEEMNIRKFVEQAQAGAEAVWQDKKDRLAYLLAKRQKEHEEKYKDVPIAKCVHVHPCIVKMHAEHTQQGHLFQMKEKQAKKMAELEFDKMWHEVSMKEADALAARMEQDAIERLRRSHDCLKNTNEQIALKKEQRKREQEILKQESLRMREIYEAETKKEEEENRKKKAELRASANERNDMMREHKDTVAQQQADEKLLNDTWDSLAGMGLADENKKKELIRRKQWEQNVCNYKLRKAENKEARAAADNALIEEEAQRLQDIVDQRLCERKRLSDKARDECHATIIEQIKEKKAIRENKHQDLVDYDKKLNEQIDQLVAHKELTLAQARKLHQSNLREQINYNNLLKQRLLDEELDQRRKCTAATQDYTNGITKIMCRDFFSDDVHPFWQQLCKPGGLKMREKCPCSKPDYCADPKPASKDAIKPGASSSK